MTYTPSDTLTEAVVAGFIAPMPFIAKGIAKAVPGKEAVVRKALATSVPLSLRAIAATRAAGTTVVLTRHGKLVEEVERGMLTRIAAWFVPDEVRHISNALQNDLQGLGEAGYAEESWRLEMSDRDIILVVLRASVVNETAVTVFETLCASYAALAPYKDIVMSRFRK